MTTAYPLAGLRVLDLSTEIAGPYCTKLLVDAGADVIKVEAPAGDPLRRWTSSGAAIPPGEDGAFFQHLNGAKRSVVAVSKRPRAAGWSWISPPSPTSWWRALHRER